MKRLVRAILSVILIAALFSGCSLIVGEKKAKDNGPEDGGVPRKSAGNAVGLPGAAGVVISENYRARLIVGGAPVVGNAESPSYSVRAGALSAGN